MIAWLANNIGTMIMIIILAAAVTAISLKLIRDKRNGRSSCGCSCAHCTMGGQCHKVSGNSK